MVHREVLKFRRGQYGKPWHSVDFSRGQGTATTDESAYGQEEVEEERKQHVLDDPSVLAIKGLGQFKEFRVVAEFRSLIENWHISDFHISEARPSTEAGYAEHRSTRGDNIAPVAQYLYEHHQGCFNRVLEVMSQRVPGVSRVEAKPTEDGRLVLRFQDGSFKDPFIARYVSDGTIKMFAYLVLLYDPKPQPRLADIGRRARFRDSDAIARPSDELTRLVPEFQKIAGARRMATHLSREGNRSRSFRVLTGAIERLAAAPTPNASGARYHASQ